MTGKDADILVSDNGFFGDVMTKSLGLTGYIVHVQLREECVD